MKVAFCFLHLYNNYMKRFFILAPIICFVLSSCKKNNETFVKRILDKVNGIDEFPNYYFSFDKYFDIKIENQKIRCEMCFNDEKKELEVVNSTLLENPNVEPYHESDYYTLRASNFLTKYLVLWSEKIDLLFPTNLTSIKSIKRISRGEFPTIDIEFFKTETEYKNGNYSYFRYHLDQDFLELEKAYNVCNFSQTDEYYFYRFYPVY